jgi:Uma2 family endonuclease
MATKTLLTFEEFERLAETEEETEDETSYELDEGELVEIPGRTMIHNVARGKTERLLGNHLSSHPDQGFVVAEEKFRLFDKVVRQPDVALVGPDQRASVIWPKDIQPFAPKLVIEIASPTNTVREITRKLRQYLDAGVLVVLIMFPDLREIHIYTASERPQILTAEDSLTIPSLLPEFAARVADLFEI